MIAKTLRKYFGVLMGFLAAGCAQSAMPTAPSSASPGAIASTNGSAAVAAVVNTSPGGVVAAQPVQHASEQIVFSGVVFDASVEHVTTPIGYWIWCTVENAETSHGRNTDVAECAGSMRFDALNLTRGISGSVAEPSEGFYVMSVSSKDGVVSCTLKNTSASLSSGPTNTVEVSCTAPAGGGTSTNGVVNVTGPKS